MTVKIATESSVFPNQFILKIMNNYEWQLWLIKHPPNTWFDAIGAKMPDLVTLTISLVIEALPFVVLGVALSVLIRLFVSHHMIVHYLPGNVVLRRACISLFGVLMPVCECGNVPVARGLMAKGFSVGDATVFLLAAPIINPITILVTWQAFSFDKSVLAWRLIAALVIANVVGYIIGRLHRRRSVLTDDFTALCEADEHPRRSWRSGLELFREELWLMMRLLAFGALVAAAVQVVIPREVIVDIGTNPVLGVAAMVLLGFIISICSSVDAFFALAYADAFSTGAIVAFLVAGPMVDIKMVSILKTTFRWPVLLLIAGLVAMFAFLIGVGIAYV